MFIPITAAIIMLGLFCIFRYTDITIHIKHEVVQEVPQLLDPNELQTQLDAEKQTKEVITEINNILFGGVTEDERDES